jgi:hypothetical protein
MLTSRVYLLVFIGMLATSAQAQIGLSLASGLGLNRTSNLLHNGSFEDGLPSAFTYWGPSQTQNAPAGTVLGWTATGGGSHTYADWHNVPNYVGIDTSNHGSNLLYFGNSNMYSNNGATPTFNANGEVTWSTSPTFFGGFVAPGNALNNTRYASSTGISLKQTLTGLTPGSNYGLSFWTSGENATQAGGTMVDGVFGLKMTDTAGNSTLKYLAVGSGQASSIFAADAHTYELTFTPAASDVTIEFINWGHFNRSGQQGTELALDDVIVNPLSASATPEPGTLSLMGLGVIALIRRCRTATRLLTDSNTPTLAR